MNIKVDLNVYCDRMIEDRSDTDKLLFKAEQGVYYD